MKTYRERFEKIKKLCKCDNSICVSRRNNKFRELQAEIKANGCYFLAGHVGDLNGIKLVKPCNNSKLCSTCQSLIKKIEELLK